MSGKLKGHPTKLPSRLAGWLGIRSARSVRADTARLEADVARYRHAFETTAADRDRLAEELKASSGEMDRLARERGDYQSAFETTAVDRDRLAEALTGSIEQIEDIGRERDNYRNAYETMAAERNRLKRTFDQTLETTGCNYEAVDWVQQHRLALRLRTAQKASRYFIIDIAGTCNLKCPSCAVGNMPIVHKRGLMSYEKLCTILDKIDDENRQEERIIIDLFNWGDPLLHPNVGRMIQEVKERGFGCGISTNLVFGKYLAGVAAAKPDYIRISLSGYGNEAYQQTHVGGDANAVKANMYFLRNLLDRFGNDTTIVQVGYHIYRTNFPNDFRKMLHLADELGYLFSPTVATIMPVEKSVAVLEGDPTSVAEQALLDMLVVHPQRWEEINLASGLDIHSCQFRDARTTINHDGSVSLCCAVYNPDKHIADSFDQTPDAELAKARLSHSYCRTCMKHRLHYVYTGIRPEAFRTETLSVLGSEYADYLNVSRFVGDRNYAVLDNEFRTVQSIYEDGMALVRGDQRQPRLQDAERYFDALVTWAPWFGEGLFQAASVKKRLGQHDEALALANAASAMVPENAAYRMLLDSLSTMGGPHPVT